jgi:hypothetical protein
MQARPTTTPPFLKTLARFARGAAALAIATGAPACEDEDGTGDAVAITRDAESPPPDTSPTDLGGTTAGPEDTGAAADATPAVVLTGTAEALRVALEAQAARLPGYVDGALRLLAALEGGDPDGVTIQTSGTSRNCAVLADLDGDGQREATVSVLIRYETAAMADNEPMTVNISHGGPGEPSLTLSARVTPTGDGEASISGATARLETPEVSINGRDGEGAVDLDAPTEMVRATMAFNAFDASYEDRAEGSFTLETVEGGYRLRVAIADDPATPADEAVTFFIDGRVAL